MFLMGAESHSQERIPGEAVRACIREVMKKPHGLSSREYFYSKDWEHAFFIYEDPRDVPSRSLMYWPPVKPGDAGFAFPLIKEGDFVKVTLQGSSYSQQGVVEIRDFCGLTPCRPKVALIQFNSSDERMPMAVSFDAEELAHAKIETLIKGQDWIQAQVAISAELHERIEALPAWHVDADAVLRKRVLVEKSYGPDKTAIFYRGRDGHSVTHQEERIFENQPILSIEADIGHTFVILEDGDRVFGKVIDNLERGVKHVHLANDRNVKIAGEVVRNAEGVVTFNLLSGTYTQQILDQNPELLAELIDVTKRCFEKEPGVKKVVYTEEELLSKKPASPTEVMKQRKAIEQ